MGPNFTKFVTMGIVWEENLKLPILWENYGNKVPIQKPIAIRIPTTALHYGNDMGHSFCRVCHRLPMPTKQMVNMPHRFPSVKILWDFYGTFPLCFSTAYSFNFP